MEWQDDDDRIMMRICAVACQLTDLPAILEDARRLTAVMGYSRIQWAASLHPDLQPVLKAGEFQRDWQDSVYLYEKTMGN